MLRRKYRKIVLLFQYQLKKNLTVVKQLHTNYSLLIALDLFQPQYQNLLIIYLKITAQIVEIKTVNLSVSLKILKMKSFLVIAKGVEKKTVKKPRNGLIEKIPNTHKFCNNDTNKIYFIIKKRRLSI